MARWSSEPAGEFVVALTHDVLQVRALTGEKPERVTRGRDCAHFERCCMRKGDGSCWCWQAREKEE